MLRLSDPALAAVFASGPRWGFLARWLAGPGPVVQSRSANRAESNTGC